MLNISIEVIINNTNNLYLEKWLRVFVVLCDLGDVTETAVNQGCSYVLLHRGYNFKSCGCFLPSQKGMSQRLAQVRG